MAAGLAASVLNSMLDSLCRAVSWTPPAAFYAKLHTGDPGAAGAANAATETTRKAVTCSAASAGAITNSSAITWAAVSTTETVSHLSFWSASVAGTFLGSVALASSRALTAGDDFEIAIGDLDIAITPVAA